MTKGLVFVESGGGDSRGHYVLSTLFSHQELSILFDNTHIAKHHLGPKLYLWTFINLTFCVVRQFISKFYAKEQ